LQPPKLSLRFGQQPLKLCTCATILLTAWQALKSLDVLPRYEKPGARAGDFAIMVENKHADGG
jgi:hypothetical protein